MESKDGVVEIHHLERGLLQQDGINCEPGDNDEEPILFTASFIEAEEDIVKYQSARWVMYSLLLILAWGIGLLVLLYLPLRRYILRKDIRSRKLYITPKAIVYQVVRPVPFPCFGNLKKEKHVLLASVADIVIEQGYMQSLFGVYSIRVENVGVRRPPRDDLHITGVANHDAFRKAVLMRLSQIRGEVLSGHVSSVENVSTPRMGHSSVPSMSPLRSPLGRDSFYHVGDIAILHKLDEVGTSVKRVQTLMEDQKPRALGFVD